MSMSVPYTLSIPGTETVTATATSSSSSTGSNLSNQPSSSSSKPSSSSTFSSSKPYTVYLITIQYPLRTATVRRRYSEFLALHRALVAAHPAGRAPPAPLPPRTGGWSSWGLNRFFAPFVGVGKDGGGGGGGGGGDDADADASSTVSGDSVATGGRGGSSGNARAAEQAKIEERRAALERYLRAIATYRPSEDKSSSPSSPSSSSSSSSAQFSWRDTEAWRKFLDLPPLSRSSTSVNTSNSSGGSTSVIGSYLSNLANQVGTASGWLEVHGELKAQIGSARAAVARREEMVRSGGGGGGGGGGHTAASGASNVTALREASTQAKKGLVRASTLIAVLDDGLNRLAGETGKDGGGGNSMPKARDRLGPGEVRRRRDLLWAARKERDALEAVLNSAAGGNTSSGGGDASPYNTTSPTNTTTTMSTNASARSSLLSNKNGSTRAGIGTSSRRVLGPTTATETPQTLSLDNAELLQLQRERVREQDDDLLVLADSVRRLREMGVAIGEELAVQTEMLDVVGRDADRVADKVRVARGRVARIK